jgi:hypothetical protein
LEPYDAILGFYTVNPINLPHVKAQIIQPGLQFGHIGPPAAEF